MAQDIKELSWEDIIRKAKEGTLSEMRYEARGRPAAGHVTVMLSAMDGDTRLVATRSLIDSRSREGGPFLDEKGLPYDRETSPYRPPRPVQGAASSNSFPPILEKSAQRPCGE